VAFKSSPVPGPCEDCPRWNPEETVKTQARCMKKCSAALVIRDTEQNNS
jgi:hypothetical protein